MLSSVFVPFALALAILGIREIVQSIMAPDVPHVEDIVEDVLIDATGEAAETARPEPALTQAAPQAPAPASPRDGRQ